MKLQAGFLAEAAHQNPDGSFMVWRGGITDFAVGAFPHHISFAVVLRFELDRGEASRLHRLQLRVVHGDEDVVPAQVMPIAIPSPPANATRVYFTALAQMIPLVRGSGEGFIETIIDGEQRMPLVYFNVVQAPPLPPGLARPSPGVPPYGASA